MPALYAASDELLNSLNTYARNGGHVLYTFRSGFSDQNVKVRHSQQPGIIGEAAGIGYDQFTTSDTVAVKGLPTSLSGPDAKVKSWMEFITPTTATVLATYDHDVWGKYAAITENAYGKGLVTYGGFMPSVPLLSRIVADVVGKAQVSYDDQLQFPLISKTGVNQLGKRLHYYFNYSAKAQEIRYARKDGVSLLTGEPVKNGALVKLEPWGVVIVEED